VDTPRPRRVHKPIQENEPVLKSLFLATLLASAACSNAQQPGGQPQGQYQAGGQAAAADARPFAVTPVADFDSPWAMTFLPDGRMLVTEKDGRLLLVTADGRTKTTVAGLPSVDSAGQGGLMDVVLAPDFARSRLVYMSASVAGSGGKGVVLMRARLAGEANAPRLDALQTIFSARPFVEGNGHYSGRIAFAPDGKHLFFTNGERQKFTPAQDPQATLGKVLRLTLDG
jgi:glucose/arabinose dehydrogenase